MSRESTHNGPRGGCAFRLLRHCSPPISLLGPATGYLNPAENFGEVYKPAIALAVVIILFEGGLTLNFKEIRETSIAVRRIVLIAGPLVWILSTLSAHTPQACPDLQRSSSAPFS